jgi:hypothetical protein
MWSDFLGEDSVLNVSGVVTETTRYLKVLIELVWIWSVAGDSKNKKGEVVVL